MLSALSFVGKRAGGEVGGLTGLVGRVRGARGKVSPSSRDADPMAAPGGWRVCARRSMGLRERELQHRAGGGRD